MAELIIQIQDVNYNMVKQDEKDKQNMALFGIRDDGYAQKL